MDTLQIAGLFAVVLALGLGLVLVRFYFSSSSKPDIRTLMRNATPGSGATAKIKQRIAEDESGEELERIKRETKRQRSKRKSGPTLDEKFFQAGIFTPEGKREFMRQRTLFPTVLAPIGLFLGYYALGDLFGVALGIVIGGFFGAAGGVQLPVTLLDRRIRARAEEILYFLPLVIEQVAIGVSSSLDVGPCLQRVVQMADERDSHNVVTELIRLVENYVRTGVSLEDALTEVGIASGHTELKHAFMALAQVAKHGGEVSRQLQELADAVATQREMQVEETIRKLELKATGPVALVFFGFIVIFLSGLMVSIKGAFG